MDDLTENSFNRILKEDWNELFKLIPEIENTNVFGEMIVGEKTPEGESIFPFMISSEIVSKFHDTVYDKNIEIVFDWGDWDEGRIILENENSDYSKLDLITLVKLITTIIRNDRFSTGYLVDKFEDGTILKILYRLKDIISETENI